MGNYGIKIGPNVEINPDEDLKDTSKYSSLKFFKWGNASFTTNGSGVGSVSIAHGLNYSPIVMVFRKFTAQWDSPDNILPTTQYSNAFSHLGALNFYGGGNESIDFDVKVNTSNLIISSGGLGNLSPNTTYNFRYYILVDLSQAFSGVSNVDMTGNYGYKVSKPGKSVLTAEEYDMASSSKYKSVQFYQNHIQETTLTLPAMFSSFHDTWVEEAVYVDFNHNLGYAPFFLSYFGNNPNTYLTSVPFYTENGIDSFNYSIGGFADASRVRIYFWRASQYFGGVQDNWSAETIKVKCIIFNENLAGAES